MRNLRGAFGPRSKSGGEPGVARTRRRTILASVVSSVAFGVMFTAGAAQANTSYKLDGALSAEALQIPFGLSVDQTTGDVWVGQIVKSTMVHFDATTEEGTAIDTKAEVGAFGALNPSGIAINPETGNVYVHTVEDEHQEIATYDPSKTPAENFISAFATPEISQAYVQIASDSEGNVYFPDLSDNTVKVYSPAGVLEDTINCESSCEGTELSEPKSVAVDSNGNIYLVDKGNNRVLKFNSSGAFQSVLASGGTYSGVGVDPATDEVFVVGDDGEGAHVVGYDSTGTEFADFGKGVLGNLLGADQVAIDSATKVVYVSDVGEGFTAFVFKFAPTPPPTATTTAATGATQVKATLNGTVNPNEGGAITSCEFEWGTTTAYSGGTVPCATKPGEGNSPVAVKGTLEGLSAKTTYHYQLVVSNGGTPVEGGDQSFTTPPNAPVVGTEAATGVGESTATLNAKVNASGDNASCKFEYGTSIGYGSTIACSISPVSGEVQTAVSAALTDLSAGTTYHYRVVATNAGGTSNGADMTLTTSSAPAPPSSAPAPAPAPPAPSPSKPKKVTCKKGFKKVRVKGKTKCKKIKHKTKKHKKKH